MRSTECEDGLRRITAKVAVPLGLNEITMFALANPVFKDTSDRINQFENFNKRELFNLAKDSIRLRGDALPTDIVEQVWSPRQIDQASAHVKFLFPEVD